MSISSIGKIRRRQLLKLFVCGGFTSVIGIKTAGATLKQHQLLDLAKLLSKQGSVKRIGNQYISSLTRRISVEEYVQLLEERIHRNGNNQFLTIENLIDSAIREDFLEGVVCDVNGWKLSRTEVHLYALSALIV